MGTETEMSETDETRPLVSGSRAKKQVMATVSNASNQSAISDFDEMAIVEKCCSHMPDDFKRLVLKAMKYIDTNPPSLIGAGSSGSYFIHDEENKTIAVFKPEDEEPYGINNPKWTKWFQKVLCPCTFGRGCLVPNQGYVSEAAAWIVDDFLKLDIVPPTAVIGLASKVFNYNFTQRYAARTKQRMASRFPDLENRFNWSKPYKKKKGSFQSFMRGYIDPDDFNREYPLDSLSDKEKHNLTVEFQKMFAFDYIIRNTDRLNANYMIQVIQEPVDDALGGQSTSAKAASPSPPPVSPEPRSSPKEIIIDVSSPEPICSETPTKTLVMRTETGESFCPLPSPSTPIVHSQTTVTTRAIGPSGDILEKRSSDSSRPERVFKIACIDNGLAFPFKHPSDIRSYPFSWARYFPYFANQPFVSEVKDLVLAVLQNMERVRQLCDRVKTQLNADKRYQKRKTIDAQLSVFRGQMYNLLKALENNLTPAHLETKRPYYAKEFKRKKKRRMQNRQPNRANPDGNADEVRIEMASSDEEPDDTGTEGSPSAAVELWRNNYSIKKHTQNPYFSCC